MNQAPDHSSSSLRYNSSIERVYYYIYTKLLKESYHCCRTLIGSVNTVPCGLTRFHVLPSISIPFFSSLYGIRVGLSCTIFLHLKRLSLPGRAMCTLWHPSPEHTGAYGINHSGVYISQPFRFFYQEFQGPTSVLRGYIR